MTNGTSEQSGLPRTTLEATVVGSPVLDTVLIDDHTRVRYVNFPPEFRALLGIGVLSLRGCSVRVNDPTITVTWLEGASLLWTP